ncbi:flagellar basal-body MS-ring/collar protein FliF [Candidatus Contubernalis alkaliaceticus]|uniref:flagellar basal-body MS-ring/collar protein FliF n=1 Tax=Candidatus Contubernalis alkaliaceticus TaxID=338645 RepID=UPI001F4C2DFD|nr:flagellar basal-body MS-ring/collar protein FliF [Candidatus Contubernalis alkalaceticus]UNC91743.1 flagellar M-ring protein FliF [Candidatus Contubernalis alkalaceticus]
MEEEQKSINSYMALWQNMSRNKKISILVFLGALTLALILFISYFSSPQMEVLFRGLSPENSSSVLARLDEMAVPYEVAPGGSILVHRDTVDELRIRLSSDGGLYSGGIGFELFDQTKLGTTEAERNINYQRALEGELQRTINQIEGVEMARVHLVLPEPSVFLMETSAPTASIFLKLNPLSTIRQDQVNGIVYLVAGSVEKLKAEDVTVIDTQGHILSHLQEEGGPFGGGLASATLSQMEIKKAFEKEMENRVQSVLERVLGAGTVVAMVTADLDFNSEEVTEIIYGEPVIRSRHSSEEEYEGTGMVPGGIAGVESNIPGYPFGEVGAGESYYTHYEEIENFEVSEVVTHTVKAPGEVRSISASIIYDNQRGTLSPRQMEDIEDLVATALGMVEERDQISVASINFDTTHLEETIIAMEEAAQLERRNVYIQYGLIALGLILLFVLIIIVVRKSFEIIQDKAMYSQMAAAQGEVQEEEEDEPELKMPELSEEAKKQRRLKEYVAKQPEGVVSLLRTWMAEDKG